MATIVQNYGPIYGEVVNGTVQGRPNGSVYVPLSNKIDISVDAGGEYLIESPANSIKVCNSSGQWKYTYYAAESQDLSNYVCIEILDSSDNVISTVNKPAGLFNTKQFAIGGATIVNGDTYKVRAVLMASNGTPVATSDLLVFEGLVIP